MGKKAFTTLETIEQSEKRVMSLTGFTLLEVMFAALVMVALLVGVLSLYASCLNLQETAKNSFRASFQLKSKMEEIIGTSFNNITSVYNNTRTDLDGLDGQMLVEVNPSPESTGGDLLEVRVIAGWTQKGGSRIGEYGPNPDNSNQVELFDMDGDAIIESPYELIADIGNTE